MTNQHSLFETQCALGGKRRIKRGYMTIFQVYRRRRHIANNESMPDQAWANETAWLNAAIDKLKGRPPETIVRDVMEDIHGQW